VGSKRGTLTGGNPPSRAARGREENHTVVRGAGEQKTWSLRGVGATDQPNPHRTDVYEDILTEGNDKTRGGGGGAKETTRAHRATTGNAPTKRRGTTNGGGPSESTVYPCPASRRST